MPSGGYRDFNPPAPCGAGPTPVRQVLGLLVPFQSTRPVRGGTMEPASIRNATSFQSTRPMRGGTIWAERGALYERISIHPPHAGRDWATTIIMALRIFQSTRPVRGGTPHHKNCKQQIEFQSTRPVRGGTSMWRLLRILIRNFNPPAPCGAGPSAPRPRSKSPKNFNPPAPCGAGRRLGGSVWMKKNFNPPAPCGAGPVVLCSHVWSRRISIHPPRAGRDWMQRMLSKTLMISIHPPRAGRDDQDQDRDNQEAVFQSTRPVRGGTSAQPVTTNSPSLFQSTRPVRGGTAIMHKIYPMHSCIIHNTTCS